MKTAFSYFPGMFENPVPAVKINCNCKLNILNQKYFDLQRKTVNFRIYSLIRLMFIKQSTKSVEN